MVRDHVVWERFAGASVIVSVVLVLTGFGLTLLMNADGLQIAVFSIALVPFVIGMVGLRHRVTGHRLSESFLGLSLLAIVAEVVGTTLRVSGVLLSVPVVALGLFVIWQSDWRLGDLAVLSIILGIGLGIAYAIEAVLHPDTGSYADQGAIALAGLGVLLSFIVITLTRSLPVWARALVGVGTALGIVSLISRSWVAGLASIGLLGLGLVGVGIQWWSDRA